MSVRKYFIAVSPASLPSSTLQCNKLFKDELLFSIVLVLFACLCVQRYKPALQIDVLYLCALFIVLECEGFLFSVDMLVYLRLDRLACESYF